MAIFDKVLAVLILSQKFFVERDFTYALYGSLVLHFFVTGAFFDGLRWQLLPTYAGVAAYYFGLQWLSIFLALTGLILDLVFSLPVVKFVPGPHSVGFIHYESKMDSASSSFPAIGTIFYPAQHRHQIEFPYIFLGDRHKLTRAFVKLWPSLPLPSWILSHWRHVRCPMAMGVVPLDAKMPVVVFSHGLSSTREMSTSLALSLASNGALVVMVEHTDGSSALARFADGTTVDYDHSVAPLGSDPSTNDDGR